MLRSTFSGYEFDGLALSDAIIADPPFAELGMGFDARREGGGGGDDGGGFSRVGVTESGGWLEG